MKGTGDCSSPVCQIKMWIVWQNVASWSMENWLWRPLIDVMNFLQLYFLFVIIIIERTQTFSSRIWKKNWEKIQLFSSLHDLLALEDMKASQDLIKKTPIIVEGKMSDGVDLNSSAHCSSVTLGKLLTFSGLQCSRLVMLPKRQSCGHFKEVMCMKLLMLSAAAAAKLLQSCLTLCDPIDGSPPGSPVPGILQAKLQKHNSSFYPWESCFLN